MFCYSGATAGWQHAEDVFDCCLMTMMTLPHGAGLLHTQLPDMHKLHTSTIQYTVGEALGTTRLEAGSAAAQYARWRAGMVQRQQLPPFLDTLIDAKPFKPAPAPARAAHAACESGKENREAAEEARGEGKRGKQKKTSKKAGARRMSVRERYRIDTEVLD